MNNIKNIVIGVVAVVALGLSLVAYNHQPKVVVGSKGSQGERGLTGPQGPEGPQGIPGPAGRDGKNAVSFGSATSNEFVDNRFCIGGLCSYNYKSFVTPAASTTCSFKLPVNASTTLDSATANLTSIASTTGFEIGYSAVSPNATTTLIAQKTITTATQDTIIATSTTGIALGNLTPAGVMAPGGFVNYKIGGGSVAGTNAIAGTCTLRVYAVQ